MKAKGWIFALANEECGRSCKQGSFLRMLAKFAVDYGWSGESAGVERDRWIAGHGVFGGEHEPL